MCGRYSIIMPVKGMADRFEVDLSGIDLKPRYNLAPGQDAPVIVLMDNRRELKMMKWGLVPSWAKDLSIGYKIINARAETVAQKPSFRNALKRRRCLIPADGFYEWKKNPSGGSKTPFRFVLKSGSPFAFAGLWDCWGGPKEGMINSFTIITTKANSIVENIHDRMPVILRAEDEGKWLDPEISNLAGFLTPYPIEMMRAYEVGTVVNAAQHDRPDCVVEVHALSSVD